MGNIYVKLFYIWTCCLKIFSYLQVWMPICSEEWNHLSNFGNRYDENFEFGQVDPEISFKDI